MSMSLLAVNQRLQIDFSWWAWRPLWHWMVAHSNGVLDHRHGQTNDSFLLNAAVMAETLATVSGRELLDFWNDRSTHTVDGLGPREISLYDFGEKQANENIAALRQFIEQCTDYGVVMS